MISPSYDCVVLGGGPAGSTVAALVAEAGFRVLLVERESLPRFHVGESLMPETYWTLQRLGVLEKMQQSGFVQKVSVQFVSHSGKESQPFYFKQHDPRDCSQTWQVERARFDQLLWENAAAKGAECRDQTRALDILLEGRRAGGARLQTAASEPCDVAAKVVVDATGQQALIANRLGIRQVHPQLRKAAIWTYYRNARRDPGENGGATIIMHTQEKNSWFWYIPLANQVTSIGVVGDHDYLLKRRGKPAEIYQQELDICPGLADRLADAQRIDEHHAAKEFSYSTQQHAGDGWLLVGDAFGFLDPIYSSGVYLAMRSGELAADAVVAGLQNGDTSAAQLGKWTDDFNAGVLWMRKLVQAFYSNDFSFGRFLRDHPHHRANLTDLLIGRVFYDGAGRIFDDMDRFLK